MLDPQVRNLVETAVNSSCKLAIAVLFAERPALRLGASEIANRVFRDRWSVESALSDLVAAGVLELRDGRYGTPAEIDMRDQLRQLQDGYADPLTRMELLRVLREVERYTPYRHELPNRFWDSLAA
jgi:hypothetical protein